MRTHWEKSLPKEIINLNILTRGRFNKIFPFFFPKGNNAEICYM